MAVVLKTRLIYYCDLESERDLGWGEGTICRCNENGGKLWKIESGNWVEKTVENPVESSGSGLSQQQVEGII